MCEFNNFESSQENIITIHILHYGKSISKHIFWQIVSIALPFAILLYDKSTTSFKNRFINSHSHFSYDKSLTQCGNQTISNFLQKHNTLALWTICFPTLVLWQIYLSN